MASSRRLGAGPDGSVRSPRRLVAATGAMLAAWALLVVVLILCGEGIDHSSGIAAVDRAVTRFVVAHRTPALDHLMTAVTWLGSWIATCAVALIVTMLAFRRRLPALAVPLVVSAWMGELLAVTLTKSVVQRPRPPQAVQLVVAHGWSFPSGHTANAMVVFATVGALSSRFARHSHVPALSWTLTGAATALVAFSRIELGVHWMTDVVASIVWTTCWIAVVVTVLRHIESAYRPDRMDSSVVTSSG